MATYRASKTHVTVKLTEQEAEALYELLFVYSNRPVIKRVCDAVNQGLRSMALRRRFAAPSVTDPRD